MLQLRNVHKRYSGIPAVENVSFTASAGEIPAISAQMAPANRQR
jgi:ABC-type multidrug transport system ATPase subunit